MRLFLRRKQFVSFLLSYMLFLLFFLTVCFYVYYRVFVFFETEVVNAHYATISQFAQSVDMKISEMEWILSDMSLNNDIDSQKSISVASSTGRRAALQKIPEHLRIYMASRQYIKEILVAYPSRDIMIMGKGTCDLSEYFKLYSTDMTNDPEQLTRLFTLPHMNDIVVINRAQGGRTEQDLLILRSVEYEPHVSGYSNIGIILSADYFTSVYDSLRIGELGNILIYDGEGSLIFASNSEIGEEIGDMRLPTEDKGVMDISVRDERYKVVYMITTRGMRYLAVIPTNIFTKKADPIKNIMMTSIFIYILVGAVSSIVFALRNYRPLQGIMKRFSDLGDIDVNSEQDEYAAIEKILSDILRENKHLEYSINRQNGSLRDFFLWKLLKGRPVRNIAEDDVLTTYNIQFPYDSFILILLHLETMIELDGHTEEHGDANVELAQFILQNIVAECLNDRDVINCCFESEGDIFVIVNVNESEVIDDTLKNVLSLVHEVVLQHFGMSFSGVISNRHDTLAGIAQCYTECMDAAEYKLVLGGDKLIFYKEVRASDEIDMQVAYPLDLQWKFAGLVKAGHFSEARELINNLFSRIYEMDSISLDGVKYLMSAMHHTIVGANESGAFLEKLYIMKRLEKCRSLTMLQKEMTDILTDFEARFNERNKTDGHSKISDILRFIQDNLRNDALSLTFVAEYFTMNPSYLSRFFKEQTGEGILYTINKKRVEMAKQLLLDDSLTLREIAGMTGFVNDTVLIRTFKKYEGVTPGKYRELQSM